MGIREEAPPPTRAAPDGVDLVKAAALLHHQRQQFAQAQAAAVAAASRAGQASMHHQQDGPLDMSASLSPVGGHPSASQKSNDMGSCSGPASPANSNDHVDVDTVPGKGFFLKCKFLFMSKSLGL